MHADYSSPRRASVGLAALRGLLVLVIVFSCGIPRILCKSAKSSETDPIVTNIPPDATFVGYFSESRGNDTGRLCTYAEPCKTLAKMLLRYGRPLGDVYAIYLTGHYTLREFALRGGNEYAVDFYHIIGQPDCWSSANPNSTECGQSLPSFDSIIFSGHKMPFKFTLENIIIRPNVIARPISTGMTDCYTAIESQEAGEPHVASMTLVNSFIDASLVKSGCITINAPLGLNPVNPFLVLNVSIFNVIPTLDHIYLQFSDYQYNMMFDHQIRIANISVQQPARERTSPKKQLLLWLSAPQNSSVLISDMELSLFAHNTSHGGFNSTLAFERVRFENFGSHLCSDVIQVDSCTFYNVLLNLTGCGLQKEPYYPARGLSVINSHFVHSSVFIHSRESLFRWNTFFSSATTQGGIDMPPVTNLYIGSRSFGSMDLAPGVIVARENYWGNPSGPSSCCNPAGSGLPVLWLADFRNWCTNENCTEFAGSTYLLDKNANSQSWDSIPECYYETYCTSDTQVVLWAALGAEGLLIVTAFIVCIVFILFLKYQRESERYKRLGIAISCIVILLSIAFGMEAAMLPLQSSSVDNVVWRISAPSTRTSLNVLVVACALVVAFSLGVLIILIRTNAKKDFYGLRFIFICIVIVTILIAYSGFMAQMMPPLIRQAQISIEGRFPDSVLSPLLRDGFIPTARGWTPWIKAMIGFFIVLLILGVVLWQILRIRDFVEVEDILNEIAFKSPLLGLGPGELARGDQEFARSSRRLAWFLILPLLLTLVTGLLQIKYPLDFAGVQQVEESLVLGLGSLLCVTGFVVFYWFYYRVVLLWLHVALWFFQSLGILTLIGFWVLWTLTFPKDEFPVPIFVIGSATFLAYLAMGIYGAVVIKRLSPRLASDLNQNLKNRMDELFENE